MTTTERSTVVGVFTERANAERSIDELENAGFSPDQIKLVEHGPGGFLDSLRSLFKRRESTTASTAGGFVSMGVPEQDAGFYQNELDAGHVVLIVNAGDRRADALIILRQNGAYDSTFRPGASASNVPPGTSNPDVPPAAYNATAQPETSAPNTRPETDDSMLPPEPPRG